MRNPHETIPSLLKLVKVGYQLRGWDEPRMARSLGVLAAQSFHTYQHPLEVLAKHPETKHAIVDYRELVAEPKRAVAEVYAALGLPLTPAFAGRARRGAEARAASTRAGTATASPSSASTRTRSSSELAELFERYHWNEGSPAHGG